MVMFMGRVLKIKNCLILVDIIDSVYYGDSKKKVLGKMNDYFFGNKVYEFIGLKSNTYSLIACNDLEVNKAKGVNLLLRHKENFDVLFGKKVIRHKMKRIQSNSNCVGTHDLNKISLSCFDDKRYVLDDGINTLAYGHKDIVKQDKDQINFTKTIN